MNATKSESNVNCAGNAAPTQQIIISSLGVESQTLPFILAFDVKQSDGVEDFYTGMSDARTESAAYRFVP